MQTGGHFDSLCLNVTPFRCLEVQKALFSITLYFQANLFLHTILLRLRKFWVSSHAEPVAANNALSVQALGRVRWAFRSGSSADQWTYFLTR